MIEASFPLSLPAVLADANQLELCLLNLGVNARDAMPDGGIVRISARADRLADGNEAGLPAGDYVRLSLADDGEGMDDATLARATEPFFTTKGVGKGTGLGLSMVHGIVQQCGGAMRLKSSQPGGTTAEIWLPFATAGASHEDVRHPMSAQAGGAPTVDVAVSPVAVLVVDDDPLVLATTVEMLCYAGFEAIGASSGHQALKMLQESGRFTSMVTDQAMPGMTGVELAARVNELHPDVHIVLASGYAELPEDAPGIHARLQKPYGRAELLEAMRRAESALLSG